MPTLPTGPDRNNWLCADHDSHCRFATICGGYSHSHLRGWGKLNSHNWVEWVLDKTCLWLGQWSKSCSCFETNHGICKYWRAWDIFQKEIRVPLYNLATACMDSETYFFGNYLCIILGWLLWIQWSWGLHQQWKACASWVPRHGHW